MFFVTVWVIDPTSNVNDGSVWIIKVKGWQQLEKTKKMRSLDTKLTLVHYCFKLV